MKRKNRALHTKDLSVYLFHNKRAALVKIGISRKPEKRKRDLECASGCELELVVVSAPVHGDCAHWCEQRLHRYFAQHRTHGEWFDDCILPIAVTYIERITESGIQQSGRNDNVLDWKAVKKSHWKAVKKSL